VVTLTDLSGAVSRVKRLGEAYAMSPLPGGHRAHAVRLVPSWAKHEPPVTGVDARLTRQHVLDLAEKADDVESCFEVFLHAMAWGYGDNGYGPYRTDRIAAEIGTPAECGTFLLNLKNEASAGWRSGYEFLQSNSPKYLGPAFGTKLLYFVSPQQNRAPILDSVVSGWLWSHGVATDQESIDSRLYDIDQYARYVNFVDQSAAALSTLTDLDDVADRGFIEYLIFQDRLLSRAMNSFPQWIHNLE